MIKNNEKSFSHSWNARNAICTEQMKLLTLMEYVKAARK